MNEVLSLLHATHLPVLLFIHIKYQIISNSTGVMACTRFLLQGDNYIMKTESSLLHATHLLVLLFIPTKYYQNMSKGIKVMERTRMSLQFCFRGDNYKTKCELSLLHTTCLLVLFIPTNYYKIIWPAQDFGFRGDNYIMKIVRVICLACNTPIGPPLHSYQILSNYV